MLSGVIDYVRGNIVMGWAHGSVEVAMEFHSRIDGKDIVTPAAPFAPDSGRVKFRLSLPRPIAAHELIGGAVVIEAVQGSERFALPVWKPIHATAAIEEFTPQMIDRALACMRPEALDMLWESINRRRNESVKRAPPEQVPGEEPIDDAALDELMRWS